MQGRLVDLFAYWHSRNTHSSSLGATSQLNLGHESISGSYIVHLECDVESLETGREDVPHYDHGKQHDFCHRFAYSQPMASNKPNIWGCPMGPRASARPVLHFE
ncbi:hypothetical protein RB213_003209 [Colletotrichum asianum]